MVKNTICILAMIVFMGGCSLAPTAPSADLHEAPAAPTPPSVGLHEAARTGNLEAIRQHIEAGSDLNQRDPETSGTPLFFAAVFGKTGAAKVLVKAGADVNLSNYGSGDTPLLLAAFLCRTEIAKLLLANGADKNARRDDGSSALDAVAGPFEDLRGIYDFYNEAVFQPLGLQLDYDRIRATRPKIAALLR